MTNQNQQASRLAAVLLILLLTGIYSCNNAATGDKAAADTATKVTTDTAAMKAADTTKPKTDTIRETKVPHPPPPAN